jgi:hypothetical protein
MPPKVGVQCTFARSVSYRVAAVTVTTTAPIEQDENVTEIVEPNLDSRIASAAIIVCCSFSLFKRSVFPFRRSVISRLEALVFRVGPRREQLDPYDCGTRIDNA